LIFHEKCVEIFLVFWYRECIENADTAWHLKVSSCLFFGGEDVDTNGRD